MTKLRNRFFNRSQKSAPVLLALVILGFGWIGISHLSKSDAAPAGYLCDNFGKGPCASPPPGGVVLDGASIGMYAAGQAWRWYEVPSGTVTSAGPFNVASLNESFKGKPVVQFQLKANTDYCTESNASIVALGRCQVSRAQKWVISDNQVVNVAASDKNQDKYVMTTLNSQVLNGRSGDYAANNQNWGWTTKTTN
ncbi:MAG TPA: hypothetical protein VLG47_04730 [Candidatus Saccharimonadales bacterium]|nr:hypothetical protein [Candidatus Saccharimonadales bacterium]